MRWSMSFIPTRRQAPADAEVASHQLLVKAGFVRQLGAGTYTYLPLGWRCLRKVIAIVRDEMARAGGQELFMPALHPAELWKQSGRDQILGDVLMRVTDRRGAELVLGPTHEEVVTALVAQEARSYREMPMLLYQIQTKFRDEPRPRSGLVRTREFLMKDAYSFDMDEEALQYTYDAMHVAYSRVFDRCGLLGLSVEADSGPMGGAVSHEFVVPTDAGEAQFVRCPGCGYAANMDCAGVGQDPAADEPAPLPAEEVETPDKKTVEDVAEFLSVPTTRLAKTLLYRTPDATLAVMVRGDHDVNEVKLGRLLGAPVEMADEATVETLSGCAMGFAGPMGLDVDIIMDQSLEGAANLVTGANKDDTHTRNVNAGRDFTPTQVADVRFANPGDRCPECDGRLQVQACLEVGHTFQLNTRYSECLSATVTDEQGQDKPLVMGCYGLGLSRILAAHVESRHDKDGIIWHPNIAPYLVDVLVVNVSDEEIVGLAERACRSLLDAGLDAIIDDRDESAGVKFKDADLIGFPLRATVSRRALSQGGLELKRRDQAEGDIVPVGRLAARAQQMLAQMR